MPGVRDQEVQQETPARQASGQHSVWRFGQILKHRSYVLPVESREDWERDGKNRCDADSENRDTSEQTPPADSLAMQPEQDDECGAEINERGAGIGKHQGCCEQRASSKNGQSAK